jgi:hypothetical protein
MVRLALLLVLLAAPVGAQDRSLLEQSSRAAVFVGNAMDLAGSVDAFSRGGQEVNPWLLRFQDKPVTFAVVKTTQAVLTVWLTDKIPNRPTRLIANFAIGGFFGYLGVRNSRVGK